MFIRNCWYVAGWDDELAPGAKLAVTIINDPIVIYRTDDGDLVALEDRCCHRFAPLSKGRIEDGCNIRCMYHGLKYDSSGRCIEIPGQDKIPTTAGVRSYPILAQSGWIWVWMGEVEKASETLIPRTSEFSDAPFILRRGHMDYKAEYQLINDNLTDFSHLSFVHTESFGATDHWAASRPVVKAIDRGIRVTRWFDKLEQALRIDTTAVGAFPFDVEAATMFQTYDYLAPGILFMYTGIYKIEDMPDDRTSWPTADALSATYGRQAVTPLGDQETRYFFCYGPREVDGGEEMAAQMMSAALAAFAEDRDMIEAQQRVIDLKPGREMLTTADVGPVQMRAVIRKLLKAEGHDASHEIV